MIHGSISTRLKEEFISSSRLYHEVFIQHEYLVCSSAFQSHPYYIFYGTRDNFLHLTGVHSHLRNSDFFDRCFYGTLAEGDFDFTSQYLSVRDVIGCAKKKSKALLEMDKIFLPGAVAEENYRKGHVRADFAIANGDVTFCFTAPDRARPKSVLGGNCIRSGRPVDLILRKKRSDELFSEIILGTRDILESYRPRMEGKLSDEIILNSC